MEIVVKLGTYSEIRNDASFVRNTVFCIEQQISKEIERDGNDAEGMHVVLYENGSPVTAARIIKTDNQYRIGRVATIKEYRGRGYGTIVVKTLIDWAFTNGINEVFIHSQKHAEEFYKALGFKSFGGFFEEAGIKHINMVIKKCDIID